jgi:hypothetical protein
VSHPSDVDLTKRGSNQAELEVFVKQITENKTEIFAMYMKGRIIFKELLVLILK